MHRSAANTLLATTILFAIFSASGQTLGNSGNAGPGASLTEPSIIVRDSIQAMGGIERWRAAGGATSEVVVKSGDSSPVTMAWTDDWRSGRARFRRDRRAVDGSTKNEMVSSENARSHIRKNGSAIPIHLDNGVVALATAYPAAALALSMAEYKCTFEHFVLSPAQSATTPDAVVLLEKCPDPHYPNGTAFLLWSFDSSTHLPLSVKEPVWGQIHGTVRYQMVLFETFSDVAGLEVPTFVSIRRTSGRTDTLQFSGTAFNANLPGFLFTTETYTGAHQ